MDGKLRNMTSIYLKKGDKVLLLYRIGSRVIKDSYTGTAGGHFEKEELNDARACVLRELYEETGLKEKDIYNLSLRYITLRLSHNEVRQNYYFFADISENNIELNSNEGKLQWFHIKDLSGLDMPFTAQYVIQHYLAEGSKTDKLYAGVSTAGKVIFHEMEEF
ncbi:MAG: NUDIX domain-containing protein [Lachnospiraceae bacterium]|nr:NUDIX domain-containing protein [Lachnospiraceae bacterium]